MRDDGIEFDVKPGVNVALLIPIYLSGPLRIRCCYGICRRIKRLEAGRKKSSKKPGATRVSGSSLELMKSLPRRKIAVEAKLNKAAVIINLVYLQYI